MRSVQPGGTGASMPPSALPPPEPSVPGPPCPPAPHAASTTTKGQPLMASNLHPTQAGWQFLIFAEVTSRTVPGRYARAVAELRNVIVFALGAARYAVELRWVREVVTLGFVTAVPTAPAALGGV